MRLQFHTIIPHLQPYIKVICSMESDEDADTSHIRVLPDACVELFINYTCTPVAIIGNKLHKQSIVTFRMSRPMDVQMRKGSGCMAICFYPAMAYRFFSQPMQVLSDTTTALNELWENLTAEIEDQLADSPDNEKRAELAQKYLLTQLALSRQDRQLEYCIRAVRKSEGNITVKDLVELSAISQRHLSRKFQHYLGLSPRSYIRVNRFIQSLSHLRNNSGISLTEIACKSGYFDQAHFIHDYQTFAGYTPGEVIQSAHILY